MKATNAAGDLYRMWPKINRYGRFEAINGKMFSFSSNSVVTGSYVNIPRAIAADPVVGLTANGKAYATHNLRKTMAFNLAYSDGSVRTAIVRGDTPLPVSGDYKAIIATIQYLEAVIDGSATTNAYSYNIYGQVPYLP